MSEPRTVLAEPLTLGQETIPRGYNAKVVVPLSLLLGFACAALLSTVPVAEDSAISMFGMRSSASAMSMSCPRASPLPMSVNAMEEALQKQGIASSPITRFVLTSYAATRDVSMAAQVKEEFSKLDQESKGKLKNLAREVVIKAETLKPSEMAGALAPLGFWDPAGFSKDEKLAVFRSAELKHGRVCMLATLGMFITEKGFHPFFDNWGDGTFTSASASHFSPTALVAFWPSFWALAGGHELLLELGKDVYEHKGNYKFDPLGLSKNMKTDAERLEMQNKELSNGRLAMIAAMGIMAQELVTGKKVF